MIVPSKFISLEDSIIGRLHFILEITSEEIQITDLFEACDGKIDNVSDFIFAIDVLYILNKISVDFNSGTIKNAT